MPTLKQQSTQIFDNLKSSSYNEFQLFKVDFDIVIHKIYYLVQTFLETLPNVVIAIIIFTILMMLSRFISRIIMKRFHVQHSSLGVVFQRLSHISFIILSVMMSLAIIFPSIKPVDLLGGFGIASLAIGFAVKDILNNFLSGILILLQQPFRVGDEIKHKDLEGIVDNIHIRYTVLIGFDGRKFLIPNGEIYANMIVVNTLSKCRTSYFEINVDLNNDLEAASKVLIDAIESVKGVFTDPKPKVSVINMTPHAITLKCSWATSPYHVEIANIRSEVIKKIKALMHGVTPINHTLSNENFSQKLLVTGKNVPNVSNK